MTLWDQIRAFERALWDLDTSVDHLLHDRVIKNRNKEGILIHGRLERERSTLQALIAEVESCRGGGIHSPDAEVMLRRLESARRFLDEILDRLFRDVFKITPPPTQPKKEGSVLTNNTKRVEVVTFGNGDVAAAQVNFDGTTIEGSSRRDPSDEPDPHTGLLLAQGRAFRKLGNSLINEANERVRTADRARRRAQADKAREKAEARKAQAERQAFNQDLAAVTNMLDEHEGLTQQVTKLTSELETVAAERDRFKEELVEAGVRRRPGRPRKVAGTTRKAPAKKVAKKATARRKTSR